MTEPALVKKIESAMAASLPRSFPVIVCATEHLQTILKQDVYSGFRIFPQEKRVVSFLAKAHPAKVSLPIELNGARILAIRDRDIFTAYTPSDEGPVFMKLLERTFGKNITTRTLDTVKKCAIA
jgi:uncharacterized protein (DUF1697 family)